MKIFPQNNSYLYENYIKKRQLENRKAGYPNSYEKFFPKQSHSKSFQLPPLHNYIIQNNEQTKFLVEHENNMKSYNNHLNLVNSKLEHNTERYISYIRNSIFDKPNITKKTLSKSESVSNIRTTPQSPLSMTNAHSIELNNDYLHILQKKNKDVLSYNKEKGYCNPKKNYENDINPYNPKVNVPLGLSFIKNSPILLQYSAYQYTPFLHRRQISDNIYQLMNDYHK